MSGLRLEKEKVGGVSCHSLSSRSFLSLLKQYRRLLSSLYGPKGGIALISNAVGVSTLATSSCNIIKQLSFGHPCFKYINALISAQNASCGLAGLFTGLLCTGLLEECLEAEEEERSPHNVIADVSEFIVSRLLTLMAQFPSQVVLGLDISDMKRVSSFVRTILGSKSCISLSRGEKDELGIQIIKAFLNSIPQEGMTNKFGLVNIIQASSSGTNSQVYNGLLYREPMFDEKWSRKISLLPADINVLLFAVPLLPEVDEEIIVHWQGRNTRQDIYINKLIFYLNAFMKENNVHLVANQKSVHPVIIFELERKGFIVLERLGTATTDALMKLSGCQAVTDVSNLEQQMHSTALGKLTSVKHLSVKDKDYLLLQNNGSNLSTLILPSVSPSIADILKETTESCLAAFKMIAVDAKVTAGGGCLEAWLAYQVGHLITGNMEYLVLAIGSPKHHIIRVANGFVRVFMKLAAQVGGGSSTTKFDWQIDSVFHHLWHEDSASQNTMSGTEGRVFQDTCMCGLVTREIVKEKYGGSFYNMDYQVTQDMLKTTEDFPCLCESFTESDVNEREEEKRDGPNASSEDLGMDADSLDDSVSEEEDGDSLDNIQPDVEEDGDSLEGRLDSLKDDDDVDSLEDVLDRTVEQSQEAKFHQRNVIFNCDAEDVLYDCYIAKYNAMRLAMEGFSQLFQIGQCVYDS